MKDQLKNTLKLLRSEVSKKLKLIRENEALAREILDSEPSGSERSSRLKSIYDANKDMLDENNELLKIQHMIVNYMSNHLTNLNSFVEMEGDNESLESEEELEEEIVLKRPVDKEALFIDTIQGTLAYNELHPLYEDEKFYKKLMDHYIEIEDYETCNDLHQLKSFKNQLN